jgi:hypothetical protein
MHRYKAVTSCVQTGFGAVPAGNRNNNGSQFSNRGTNVYYWSSSVNSAANAWNRQFNYNNAQVNRNNNSRSNGFSVRCVQRESTGNRHKRAVFFMNKNGTLCSLQHKNYACVRGSLMQASVQKQRRRQNTTDACVNVQASKNVQSSL